MSFNNTETMALYRPKTSTLITKQIRHLLSVHQGALIMLIIAQVFGLLLSVGAEKTSFQMDGNIGEHVKLSLTHYNGQALFLFPMLVVMGLAFSLGLKQTKNMMATYISNGQTNVLANTLFIGLLSFAIGMTSYVVMTSFKLFLFQFSDVEQYTSVIFPSITEMIFGCFAAILYIFLFSMIAYFAGETLSFHKLLFIIIQVGLFLFYGFYGFTGIDVVLERIVGFYGGETNILLFAGKVLGTCFILLCLNLLFVAKEEVRK